MGLRLGETVPRSAVVRRGRLPDMGRRRGWSAGGGRLSGCRLRTACRGMVRGRRSCGGERAGRCTPQNFCPWGGMGMGLRLGETVPRSAIVRRGRLPDMGRRRGWSAGSGRLSGCRPSHSVQGHGSREAVVRRGTRRVGFLEKSPLHPPKLLSLGGNGHGTAAWGDCTAKCDRAAGASARHGSKAGSVCGRRSSFRMPPFAQRAGAWFAGGDCPPVSPLWAHGRGGRPWLQSSCLGWMEAGAARDDGNRCVDPIPASV